MKVYMAVMASQHTYALSQSLHLVIFGDVNLNYTLVSIPTIISGVGLYRGGNLHLFHSVMLECMD